MPRYVATFPACVSIAIGARNAEAARRKLADALADGSEALTALDLENDPAITCGEGASPAAVAASVDLLEIESDDADDDADDDDEKEATQ